MHLRLIIAAAVMLSSAALAGCARINEALEPEPIVVTQEATAAVVAAPVEGALADGHPADLPMWPGASVVSSEFEDETYTLEVMTTDSYDDVLNGVAAGFERAEWTIIVDEQVDEAPRSAVFSVASGALEGLVTISEVESSTVGIAYVLTPVGQ